MSLRDHAWKPRAALTVWGHFLTVWLTLRRRSLPEAIRRLGGPPRRAPLRLHPAHWSRLNDRLLRAGRFRPRCLLRALVLYRCLRAQGHEAVVVIGLPREAAGKDAHAWVELDGREVGPAPGRAGHVEFVRYPETSPPV